MRPIHNIVVVTTSSVAEALDHARAIGLLTRVEELADVAGEHGHDTLSSISLGITQALASSVWGSAKGYRVTFLAAGEEDPEENWAACENCRTIRGPFAHDTDGVALCRPCAEEGHAEQFHVPLPPGAKCEHCDFLKEEGGDDSADLPHPYRRTHKAGGFVVCKTCGYASADTLHLQWAKANEKAPEEDVRVWNTETLTYEDSAKNAGD